LIKDFANKIDQRFRRLTQIFLSFAKSMQSLMIIFSTVQEYHL